MNPSCANYSIWTGLEIEGATSLGVKTLFIRSLASFPSLTPESDFSFMRQKTGATRCWFCKEFRDWPMVRAIAKHFDEFCIEVEPKDYDSIPLPLRKHGKIYLKVNLSAPLKDGDHICVGPAFSDEAFKIGDGKKVNPELYLKDTKIV